MRKTNETNSNKNYGKEIRQEDIKIYKKDDYTIIFEFNNIKDNEYNRNMFFDISSRFLSVLHFFYKDYEINAKCNASTKKMTIDIVDKEKGFVDLFMIFPFAYEMILTKTNEEIEYIFCKYIEIKEIIETQEMIREEIENNAFPIFE